MANKPFEYTIINPLERPTSTDINQLQAQAHYDVRLLAEQLFAGAEGFVGDSAKAVPLSVPSLGFSWTPGIMFTVGTAENNIGAISGLSDSYLYKATNIAYRPFNVTTAPATSGYVRYDLLEVRALTGSERLTDSTSVGIFNPSLGSFNVATSKYKTLTSSLDPLTTVEEIAYNVTGTAPLVYKSGQEIAYPGAWSLVPKPTVDSGYLAVAYIRRFEGQTEITSGVIEDARTLLTVSSSTIATVPVTKGGTGQEFLAAGEVLLGNGTSGITSTAILPISKGGTGNGNPSAFMGSVAYYDDSTDQLKYSQAIKTFVPRTGWLLASNSTGAPTWIEPGAAGLPLISTGSAWEAGKVPTSGRTGTSASGVYQNDIDEQLTDTSYQLLNVTPTPATFSIVGNVPYTVSFLPGAASPWDGEFAVENKSAIQLNTVSVKIEIYSGASVIRQWVLDYRVPALQWRTLSPLTVTDVRPSDYANCTVRLSIKSDYANDIWYTINNVYFFFAQ